MHPMFILKPQKNRFSNNVYFSFQALVPYHQTQIYGSGADTKIAFDNHPLTHLTPTKLLSGLW